ncbi:hypothetical protein AGMMS50262_05080 [Bacteroidia bacterium]|nr:hypothetical protein AGMMS50262_05080 [Bacteroidia bacterium]
MDENFTIRLSLADKFFPYKCKRSDEGNLRKAARNLNDKVNAYSSYYSRAKFGMNDILTLAGFHFSLAALENENREDMSPMFNKIEQLNKELEEYIKSLR